MAIPSGAREALGSTPIRIPLPCDNQAEAARYARRLAGVAEGWFMALNKQRFTGLSAIAASTGHLENPRKRLYDQLVTEIHEITSQVAALEELRKPRKVTSNEDVIAHLQQRNAVLESILANLNDKAKAIAGEYADFFEEVGHERALAVQDQENQQQTIADIEWEMGQQVTATSRALGHLKDRVVEEATVRTEVSRETLVALAESKRLREVNEELTKRIDYRGPALSEAKAAFLEDRSSKLVSKKLVADLGVKIDLFIALIGDKPVGTYRISDLQRFAARLSHLPQRHSVKPGLRGYSTVELIEEHEKTRRQRVEYLTENTIKNNFVGRVKTAIRWICAEHGIDYPFRENIRIVVPAARASVIRHGFSREQVNHLLRRAVASRHADEAWLPFVALLTGARISELVMMSPDDLLERDGVWVADLTRHATQTRASHRSVKTQTSRRYLVLHEALVQRGFVKWAKWDDRAWVFADFHDAANPAGAASKRFQRLFKIWGMTAENVEVFHALRHTYKDVARAANIEERTIALQTGHSLAGVAMNYGSKILRPDEMQRLSALPVPDGWDLGIYNGLEAAIRNRMDGAPKTSQRRKRIKPSS
jgi:integrase